MWLSVELSPHSLRSDGVNLIIANLAYRCYNLFSYALLFLAFDESEDDFNWRFLSFY
jgi:hypothetical protein